MLGRLAADRDGALWGSQRVKHAHPTPARRESMARGAPRTGDDGDYNSAVLIRVSRSFKWSTIASNVGASPKNMGCMSL